MAALPTSPKATLYELRLKPRPRPNRTGLQPEDHQIQANLLNQHQGKDPCRETGRRMDHCNRRGSDTRQRQIRTNLEVTERRSLVLHNHQT